MNSASGAGLKKKIIKKEERNVDADVGSSKRASQTHTSCGLEFVLHCN